MGIAIADAIGVEDIGQIKLFFQENPEQVDVHTFMGGQTWLGYAAQKGALASVRALIDCGFGIDTLDRNGATPLNSAAAHGNLEVVQYLVGQGAKLDFSSTAANPLFGSVLGKSHDVAQVLLDAGIDATKTYSTSRVSNMTAVAFALMWGQTEIANTIAVFVAKAKQISAEQVIEEGREVAALSTAD